MERLRRFARLRSEDRRLLLEALAIVTTMRVALWVLPFGRLRAAIRRVPPHPRSSTHPPRGADRIAWSVASAALFVPKASCLTQALAAEMLLRRAGLPADLRIGVATDAAGALEAHAWIESEGRVLIGDLDLDRFTPLAPPVHAP